MNRLPFTTEVTYDMLLYEKGIW